jgi:acetylornithine deacetylase/succinyl-diaminopimelate desuccinylase-like protein
VPPAEGWTVEPFSGARQDGFLWGPGAVDDKSLGIAHLLGFLESARADEDLAHDLILLAVADEETGGAQGTAWILERHPELFADTVGVLTEGGSNRVFNEKTFWWGIEVAQKRPLWLEVETRGRPGHGSRIDLHSAPNQLLRALNGVLDLPREYRLVPEVRSYFESIASLAPQHDDWLSRAEAALASERMEGFLQPGQHNLFLDTIQVTVLDSGQQVNAIPNRARAQIDVRALPDADLDALLNRIQSALGDNVEVRVLLDAPPVEPSPADSTLFLCLQESLADRAPAVPMMIAGVTDARHFRRLGIPAYGFSPFAAGFGDAQGVHGSDERISEQIFERGVVTMTRVIRDCTGR